MARNACALILIAGLISGCSPQVRYVPQPVPIEKECPTLGEQISASFFSPLRELGREEVYARGGLNRHLWLVFLEMEQELKYANERMLRLQQQVEGQ